MPRKAKSNSKSTTKKKTSRRRNKKQAAMKKGIIIAIVAVLLIVSWLAYAQVTRSIQIKNMEFDDNLIAIENEIIVIMNNERVSRGLSPLIKHDETTYVARLKSYDMIKTGYFSHNSPIYGSPYKMMKSFDIEFTTAGENIAYGQRNAQDVMTAWMNSPGHRANILSRNYTHIGVGVMKKDDGTLYFTQMFLTPA